MTRKHPKEPTPEQCSTGAKLDDFDGCAAYACWYPQMGGYVGKCVVVIPPDDQGDYDRCFDAYVWHDGAFPFSKDDPDRSPVRLHHCVPSQFVRFGEFVVRLQKGGGKQ